MPRHAIARWGTGRLLSDSGDVFVEVAPIKNQNLPLLHGPVSHSKMMMRRYNEINQLLPASRHSFKRTIFNGAHDLVYAV